MPRKPTQQQAFDALLDRYGPEIAKAFEAAIDDLRTAAELQKVITAIEAGNIEAAIAAMHLDAAAYAPLLDVIQGAYGTGGTTAAGLLTGTKVAEGAALLVRFNVRNPRAEAWLRDHSSRLVTRILDDQRTAIREALREGMAQGQNPRTTALSVVGRVNRATGKREGGIIGLTAQQEGFVRNARAELSSGDPATMKNYFERARRDKRFDRTVQKAINEERPVDAATLAKIETTYRNRLLKLRGDMIGRTESLTSLRAAQHEAYLQAVEAGTISEASVRRTWRSAHDPRVRTTHAVLDGDTVGLRELFRSPRGALMMYPGDTSHGAGPEEVIGCRCVAEYRIDFLSNLG